MDPKLLFWTGALANLGAIVVCGKLGVDAVRRGDWRRHRRFMLIAAALIGIFLGSYVAKVAWLGREDRSAWTALDYAVLYVHELCIAVMLVAGGTALFQAFRHRALLVPNAAPPSLSTHRRAGRVAAWAGVLAFLTAGGVWGGMLARAWASM